MKVMVIVKATASSEAGELPSQELMDAMGEFNQQLIDAGIMESGDGLKPSSAGYRVRFNGSSRALISGPFAETNELIAGYWIWNVSSIEQAIEWVKKCPNPMPEESEIEIRPFYSFEDYAQWDQDGSFAAKEQVMRDTISFQQRMHSASLNNYLFFAGQCEQALQYYQQHLGATLTTLMRFSDSPEPVPEELLAPGFEHKVMHCEFTLGNSTLFASDGCNTEDKPSGFSLAFTVADAADATRVFEALAHNGQVVMPLAATFWSPLYGQVIDQFGIPWMIMLPPANPV